MTVRERDGAFIADTARVIGDVRSLGVGAAGPWRTELTELTGGCIVPGTSGPPMAVKDGKVASSKVGAAPKSALQNWIESAL